MQHITLALGLLSLAPLVHGHGHLIHPKPKFVDQFGDPTKFCATLDGPNTLPGSSYNQGPDWNTAEFTKHFKASKYGTLKAFLDALPSGGDCGITDGNGPAQALPSVVQWANGPEGFISSHQGPCELWCDATRVYQNDNCAANQPDGKMEIDTAKCAGAKRLTFLWLALHTADWQVYKNCVNLSGAAPPSPSTNEPRPSTNEPSPTTDKPSPSTYEPSPSTYKPNPSTYEPNPSTYGPKPSPSPSSVSPSTSHPIPTTHAPRPSTYAPSPSTGSPTMRPTTTAPNPNGPVQAWSQCGGKGYTGPTKCVAGFQCQSLAEFYAQCVPNAPGKGQLGRYAQCGGMYYTGSTECSPDDACVPSNVWFSQCLPKTN